MVGLSHYHCIENKSKMMSKPQRETENNQSTQALLFLPTATYTFSDASLAGFGAIEMFKHLLNSKQLVTTIALGNSAFAGAVGLAVYFCNVKKGIRHLRSEKLRKQLLVRSLIMAIALEEQNKKAENNLKTDLEIYQLYTAQLRYLASLKKASSDTFYCGEEKIKELIEKEENTLHELEDYFIKYLENEEIKNLSEEQKEQIKSLFSDYTHTFKNRNRVSKAGLIFNWLAMPGYFFFSIYVCKVLLTTMGIAITFSPWALAPVAIFSTGFFFIMFYNTMIDIIYKDTLLQCYRELKYQYQNDNKKAVIIAIQAILFSVLFAALILATAGTWLKTGLRGQAMLFKFSKSLGNYVFSPLIMIYVMASLVFYVKNMLTTVYEFNKEDHSDTADNTPKKEIRNHRYNEIFLTMHEKSIKDNERIVNGFFYLLMGCSLLLQGLTDFISACGDITIFIAHCAGEGASIDSPALMPATFATTLFGATTGFIAEVLFDYDYVFPERNKAITENTTISHKLLETDDTPNTFAMLVTLILVASVFTPLNYLLQGWLMGRKEGAFSYMCDKMLDHWHGDHFGKPENPQQVLKKPPIPNSWTSFFPSGDGQPLAVDSTDPVDELLGF